jgi:hypothetical protein
MAETGIDYSNWRPPGGAAQLQAAGVKFVARYIYPLSANYPKALTPLEILDLAAHGIAIVLVFEENVADYLGGYAQGVIHAGRIAQALADLKIPPGTPVYIAIDTEVLPGNFAQAAAYLQGIKDHLPGTPLGLYTEGALIEAMFAAALIQYGWESMSKAFLGNGSPTAHTVEVQLAGQRIPGLPGDYDVDTALVDDYGQTPRPNPAGQEAPPPKVMPAHFPPEQFSFADVLYVEGKGCWGLQYDWGVITLGGSFHGTMHGNPAVAGRVPARIIPAGAEIPGANPPLHEYPPTAVYEIIDTAGERYLPA